MYVLNVEKDFTANAVIHADIKTKRIIVEGVELNIGVASVKSILYFQ